jgi:hypothetical protein
MMVCSKYQVLKKLPVKKTVFLTVIFMLVIVHSLVGCSKGDNIQDGSTPESTLQVQKSPHIRGMITTLSTHDDNSIGLLVEGVIESDTRYDKAYVLVDKDTKILSDEDNGGDGLMISDLKIGQTIEVFFVGPIATSYPVQATAGKINIIEALTE